MEIKRERERGPIFFSPSLPPSLSVRYAPAAIPVYTNMQFHCPTSFQRQSTDFILRLPREELGLGRGRGGGGRGGGGGQKRARKTEESGSSGSSGVGGRRKKMARKTAKLEVAAADPDGRRHGPAFGGDPRWRETHWPNAL